MTDLNYNDVLKFIGEVNRVKMHLVYSEHTTEIHAESYIDYHGYPRLVSIEGRIPTSDVEKILSGKNVWINSYQTKSTWCSEVVID